MPEVPRPRSDSGRRVGLLCALLLACQGRAGEAGQAEPPAHAGSSPKSQSSASAPSPTFRAFRLTARGGIGFDDLLFSSDLHAVLAPGGGTGCVNLFDSSTLNKTELCGVSPGGSYAGGHGEGTTSADAGAGFVFAIDRNTQSLKVVEPRAAQVVAAAPLAGGPDYVRWIESAREVWVTEPDREQIEVFALSTGSPPTLSRVLAIPVQGGPESLVVDANRGKAFTHLWAGRTVPIDISKHTVGAAFANGCRGSRGIALDPKNGLLFTGCAEGRATALDLDRHGKLLGSVDVASGVDIIAVNLDLRHVYVPSASDGSVAVLGVSTRGVLRRSGEFRAAKGAHCVASDDHGRAWICAPDAGSVLVFDDTFPRAAD
jgi:hypothetical protein